MSSTGRRRPSRSTMGGTRASTSTRTSGSSTTSADRGLPALDRGATMSRAAERGPAEGWGVEIDENGVVNPLRAPAVVRNALRGLAGLRPLAMSFAALAVVVLIGRIVEFQAFAPIMIGEALV